MPEWTITTAGAAALAAAHLASMDFVLDRVKFGQGQYTPTGSETDILTPFAPVREFTNPQGYTDDNKVTAVFSDGGNDTYAVGEVGVFSGTTLYAIASQPSSEGVLFTKPVNVPYQFAAQFVVDGDEISAVTFNEAPAVMEATTTMPGVVRLAADGDSTSTGAVAVNPAQVAAIANQSVDFTRLTSVTSIAADTAFAAVETVMSVSRSVRVGLATLLPHIRAWLAGVANVNAATPAHSDELLFTQRPSGGTVDLGRAAISAVVLEGLGQNHETIQDIIGAMVAGNTETRITVTYDDDDAKLNFVVSGTEVQVHTTQASYDGASSSDNKLHVLAL